MTVEVHMACFHLCTELAICYDQFVLTHRPLLDWLLLLLPEFLAVFCVIFWIE